MPIYEYQCSLCGHKLEALQKMSDKALTDCPTCHKPSLQKLISAAGFQLKGSGWYITDYKNKPKSSDKSESSANNSSDNSNKTDPAKKSSEAKSEGSKSSDTSSS